ncbi:LysR family transcriptional regulator [Agarilytica rhodophyticola]|uniref:LysR family transcriptional regulator n=1 Tax=Agarilytica rhodophyticola TaxID=1737490 RepID=UPI000B34861B|nr:LysR family transcriptional regulator [Agarilytica rhodophyticola]
MDTKAIRLFVMSADMQNISAAGRKLKLTPSMASARLSKLEVQLGADLFHRTTRKISLSVEGESFLPYAREILAQEDAALGTLGRDHTDVCGTLRFAASSSFSQRFILPIMPDFYKRYPHINFELKLSDLRFDLINGGYDLALRNAAITDSSLISRRLARDKRILCASPNYLEQNGIPKTPADLKLHQLILFAHSNPRVLHNKITMETSIFPPAQTKPRMICDDGTSMRIAAESGVGICMSSMWNVHSELNAGKLVRVLPEYSIEDKTDIWLVYPKSNVITAKVRVFIDYLVEKIGDPPVWEL